jgi:argininosuccinate synthase
MSDTVVLAFSGGLDTSYCVPVLIERGYDVVTLHVGTDASAEVEAQTVRERALELGAADHVYHDASGELWDRFVTPFVMGGVAYQDQYPLLCSDRYEIASRAAALAETIGARAVAHGCTAMGNDQVRFDLTLRMCSDLPVLAPIRDLQGVTDRARAYEIEYLRQRGFAVDDKAKRYTINTNLLGATLSGDEIDRFEAPSDQARVLTAPPAQWPSEPERITLEFHRGVCTGITGTDHTGPEVLSALNTMLGAHGVGRACYTGDTVVGLKGRIVFEAPGLTALLTAHRALEELTLTREQNHFKPVVARKWTELVFSGLYHEPLTADLEAMIASTQANVSGRVTLEAFKGTVHAVAIDADNPLVSEDASYAQHASWSGADAAGFIRITGNAPMLGCAAAKHKAVLA